MLERTRLVARPRGARWWVAASACGLTPWLGALLGGAGRVGRTSAEASHKRCVCVRRADLPHEMGEAPACGAGASGLGGYSSPPYTVDYDTGLRYAQGLSRRIARSAV